MFLAIFVCLVVKFRFFTLYEILAKLIEGLTNIILENQIFAHLKLDYIWVETHEGKSTKTLGPFFHISEYLC